MRSTLHKAIRRKNDEGVLSPASKFKASNNVNHREVFKRSDTENEGLQEHYYFFHSVRSLGW